MTHRAGFAWFAWLAGAAFQVMLTVLLIVLPDPASMDNFGRAFGNRLAGAAVGALFALFFCHLGRCRITAARPGITIEQPLARYVLPWSQ
ncbi:MAG TPA: hypothetical protein VMV92_03590 [Streptosporangiaceae bacterium]|nr:hypothetical protein [Streptosporangiaceae bacterium]